jgi:bilirubin oxidase
MPQNMGPTEIQGPFMINNAMFDMNIINYIIPLNNIEVWTLTNESPIGHPFHLHDVSFYVLDINGVAPPLNLQGRKDVIHVPGGMGTLRFITKFEDYANDNFPYMYHCHILTHEDMGMMGQFLVTSNVGIEEQNEGLKIFPNPTSDILTLETSFINSKYTVLDHTGRIVLKGILEEKISSIDVQHLSSGIYFLNVPEKMINLKFIRK